jgi:hypothetical protein
MEYNKSKFTNILNSIFLTFKTTIVYSLSNFHYKMYFQILTESYIGSEEENSSKNWLFDQ